MLGTILAAGGVLDPKFWIEKVGLFGIFAIIFAETGLLIGFFLPGDSLLFTAGFIASGPDLSKIGITEDISFPLIPLMIGVALAAIIGDQVGYMFGAKVGPALFRRPDSRLFKVENIDRAQRFFDRYGAKTIVLARFVPIVRTFAPVVAGVSKMRYRTFLVYNVIGGVAWGAGLVLLGYFLGQVTFFQEHLELAVLFVVAISLIPIVVEALRARRHRDREPVPADLADR
jgi:membrane-associated protein